MRDSQTSVHPWEEYGLGLAPFRFMGVFEKTYQACQGAPVQAAGLCDACGACIRDCYKIRSADGKDFVVGCDCVRKLDRYDNRLMSEVEAAARKLQREKNAVRKEAQRTRDIARINKAQAALVGVRAQFESQPHPSEYFAKEGATLADYLDFLFTRAGVSGGLRAARMVEDAVKGGA